MYRNLKAEMSRNNISPNDIAKYLGVSEYRIKNMIYGKVKFSVLDAIKIKNEFFKDMSVEYLFYV